MAIPDHRNQPFFELANPPKPYTNGDTMLRICIACRSPFRPHPNVPSQKYCSQDACQRARRREWQQRKLQSDEDYKTNQKAAQKEWCRKNPHYWKLYRLSNPDYAARNKTLQKLRNTKARNAAELQNKEAGMIANMDASIRKPEIISGYYMLYPVAAGKIAKMDQLLVRIDVITSP